VSADAFNGLADLRSVILDRNRVRTLDACLVAGLGRHVELSVAGNPVTCSCDEAAWVVDAAAEALTVVGECWDPAGRRGLPLARFNATACPSRPDTQTRCGRPHPTDRPQSSP